MRVRIIALFVSTALLALPAIATDLTVSTEAIVEYDDNAFRTGQNEDDDFFFRIRPEVKIHEDRGQDFRYSLTYGIPFEFAVENGDELDDIDHILLGELTYHASDRLDLYINDQFRSLRGGTRDIAVDDRSSNDQLVNSERDRVLLNNVGAGTHYRFSPRVSGSLNLAHELFTSERRDRGDDSLIAGTGSLSFVLDPKHTLGGGVQISHQESDASAFILGSEVMSYHVFGQWDWQYDETTQFRIRVGPSYLDARQDDAPTSVTRMRVPSVTLPNAITLVATDGWRQSDGSMAVGTFEAGSVVVSQVSSCPPLGGVGGTPVLTGEICPFDASNPATAPVILDIEDNDFLGDDLLINEVLTQEVTLTNPNPSGDDSTRLDVFAEIVATKRWTPTFASALRYTRNQGGASGLGGAVINDSVNLSNNWQITDKWEFFVRGDWSLRQAVHEATRVLDSVTEVTSPLGAATFNSGALDIAGRDAAVGSLTSRDNSTDIDTMRWGIASRLTRRFTRNTSGWIQLTYNQQESTGGTLGNTSDFENFLGSIGVRHTFDPIKLW